jgi:radical SAM-linked protein
MSRQPSGPQAPPVVQRVRLRYAKRGRLRFSSHRDFARAFERALRRAEIPMAYSSGFTPHPRISYLGAAPTGVASEAEYVEIALQTRVDVEELRDRIDAVLPDGLDIVEAVEAAGGGFADRLEASLWRIELPGVSPAPAAAALAAFLATTTCPVERLTKDGRREVDARAAVISAAVIPGEVIPGEVIPADGAGAGVSSEEMNTADSAPNGPGGGAPDGVSERGTGTTVRKRAIMTVAIRQVIPAVRPDDVLTALCSVGGLALDVPPRVVRLAQGPLNGFGAVGDPLADDRVMRSTPS